jgi:hypothetical protein
MRMSAKYVIALDQVGWREADPDARYSTTKCRGFD